ncbi:MAG: cytochrome c [Bradyrhizobium sp.]|uniref:c-type cytochrome n=1 Tax=Bradyrhizobium sp. TaxID=376 RepID=UPI001E086DC0|nr:cytochrome c [Bradyrhizobium sp.]MBV9560582.1 cytochrome c [Bradyrhizobium sp.]
MTRIVSIFLAVVLALVVIVVPLAWFVLLRPVAQPATNDPLQVFDHGSIGNESAQGIPYWIWRVLPTLFPEYLPGNQDGYGSIGVYWVAGEELPVGFSKKTLGVIPRVAPNCAFCHQGSYRLHAGDPATFVPAGAGTRVNIQGFLRFLTAIGRDKDRFTTDKVMAAITGIYDMPLYERLLYRYLLIPAVRKAFAEQATRFAWMDPRPDCPRPDWGPGRIDPFNPVKFFNLKLPDDCTIGNSDIMPLWHLDGLADPKRETSLHWDGLSTNLRETAVAGAIGDGMDYQGYAGANADLTTIIDFVRLQMPPPSPFSTALGADDPYHVDVAQVEKGKAIYLDRCAVCHEPGGARFRTVISAAELDTDRHRIDMWTEAAKDRYTNYREGGYNWGFKAFHKTNGYLANELSGLWLRAPYLHNGSVPTLRDLLAAPSERPKTFYRGYDLVDPANGGFVSQAGTVAERFGTLYDTSVPGNANSGHAFGTDLPAGDKDALVAFLKTL